MSNSPKVPHRPSGPLTRTDDDLRTFDGTVLRVHRTTGPHVLPWNGMRHFGPVSSMRFDPHPEPVGHHPGVGVTYAAVDLTTCLAEVFRATRTIDVATGMPHLTAWAPTRPMTLLDLTGTWPVRNGAAASLTSAPHAVCRTWARTIHRTWPDLDGLFYQSTWTGHTAIALWTAAADSFPHHPVFSRPLGQPLVWSLIRGAAADVGFGLV